MIPSSCVDNFYENPDSIRDFALSLDYYPPNKDEFFPGERTHCLSLVDKKFYHFSVQKFLSCFFELTSNTTWKGSTHFQKIYKCNNDKHHLSNVGWVHRDEDQPFKTIAAVLYLNKNTNFDSGTKILQMKKNSNHEFDVTIDFKNCYNRMVAYDGYSWHQISSFWVPEKFRLTQVFFIEFLNNIPHRKKTSFTESLHYE
jgi:hypothetical protein|tara:strand:- start:38 stop:634 length:597 start_codon:yes stop_codon:yes gene_type:complete